MAAALVSALTAAALATVALAAALVSALTAAALATVAVLVATDAVLTFFTRLLLGVRWLGLVPVRLRGALRRRLGGGLLGGGSSRLRRSGGGRSRLLLRLAGGLGGLRSRPATGGQQLGRRRELLDLKPLMGDIHVVDEDVRRVGRTGDLLVLAPRLDRLLRAVRSRLVEGHRGDHLRGEAHELGGLVVRRRSGLRGDRAIHLGGHLVRTAVRSGDDLLEGVGRVRHDVLIELAMPLGVGRIPVRAVGVLEGGHDVGVVPDALRGEGGVGRRNVDRVRGGRPEHVLDEHPLLRGLQTLGVLRIAGAVRHLGGDPFLILQIRGIQELLIELQVGGVERLLRRLSEAGPLQGDVLEVLELVALNGHRRGGRITAVQGPPVLQGGHQREGLEGGAGLGNGVSRGVDLTDQVVLTPVESQQTTRLGVDGHQRLAQVRGGARRQGVDRVDGGLLVLLVDRGDDLEAAGVDLLRRDLGLVLELGAHHLQQVAVGAGVDLLGLGLLDVRHTRLLGLVVLSLGDVAVVEHELQDSSPPFLGLLRVLGRVPSAGRRQDPRQERGLRGAHVLGGMVEEGLRGGLDAIGATTVVDRVEVVAQDLLLGLLPVDLDGHDGLLELAGVGAGGVDVVVLHVLLRQGRGALGVASAQVVDQGARDALGVDALVGVEGAVLRGHHRVTHIVRQGRGIHGLPVDLGELPHLRGSVGVVDRAALSQRELTGLGHLDGVISPHEGADGAEHPQQEDAQDEPPAGDPAVDLPLAGAGVVEETALAPRGGVLGALGRRPLAPLAGLLTSP